MSPVLFPSSTGFAVRRRIARPTAASLFPDCPDTHSPENGIADLAPVDSDPRSSNPGTNVADCPPPQAVSPSPQSSTETGTRAAVAEPSSGANAARANAPLVGIARLAAKSPAAESRRTSAERPEYFFLPVKSILNRCDSQRVPFEWTVNPYRGCEFGCHYCYARYTHEYMELDGGEFEKKIFVKKDAAALLAWDVSHKYSYQSQASGGRHPDHIAIGTATDPYQPAEKEHGVTRACLEELAKREGLSISVITKSNMIVRDIDVFKRIAERSSLSLNLTITTLRPRLARLLEPRAPRPDLRVAAVKQLHDAGLTVGVSASPLIPGITDREGELEELAAAVRAAGAEWFFSNPLFLMPSSAKQFLPFVRAKFPRLAKQYQEWYAKNGYAPEEYRRKAAERVARIRKEHGFSTRPWEERNRAAPCAQMSLALNTESPAASRSLGKIQVRLSKAS
jgi:DNA repair photolyase